LITPILLLCGTAAQQNNNDPMNQFKHSEQVGMCRDELKVNPEDFNLTRVDQNTPGLFRPK